MLEVMAFTDPCGFMLTQIAAQQTSKGKENL